LLSSTVLAESQVSMPLKGLRQPTTEHILEIVPFTSNRHILSPRDSFYCYSCVSSRFFKWTFSNTYRYKNSLYILCVPILSTLSAHCSFL